MKASADKGQLLLIVINESLHGRNSPQTRSLAGGGGSGIRTHGAPRDAQRFSSSKAFVLSGPSSVIWCCPVQAFVLSSPSGAVLCCLVWFAACLQIPAAFRLA